MSKDFYQITLALAGIFQASQLVNEIAYRGFTVDEYFDASLNSIYALDAPDVPSVFGGEENLVYGLSCISDLFDDAEVASDPDISRYALSLIHLERKLIHDQRRLDIIRTRIEHCKTKSTFFSEDGQQSTYAYLADIYTENVATLGFRIHVTGKQLYLEQTQNVNKIRTLLLAGIRSAVLWRQVGGNRWQLFFSRNKIAHIAQRILSKY